MPEENNTSLEELKQRIKELKEQGDWEEVERIQRGVLEAVPTCLRAMVDLVIIAKIRDDWEEVERLQRMKMELEPDDPVCTSDLVMCAKKRDDWEEIERLQSRRLELEPKNTIVMSDLVTCAKKRRDWEKVKELQTRRLELEPQNIIVLKDLILCAKKIGDWETLKKIQTQRINSDPTNYKAMCDLVGIAKMEDNWVRAEELQTEIIKLIPDDSRARHELDIIRKRLETKEADLKEHEDFNQKQIADNNEGITDIRTKLYAGEIDISQISDIADMYKGSAQGTILIAEVCTYFGRQNLAIRALKAYIKEHEGEMSVREKTQLKGAMQIAGSKQRIKDSVKWAGKYNLQGEEQNTR